MLSSVCSHILIAPLRENRIVAKGLKSVCFFTRRKSRRRKKKVARRLPQKSRRLTAAEQHNSVPYAFFSPRCYADSVTRIFDTKKREIEIQKARKAREKIQAKNLTFLLQFLVFQGWLKF